MQPKRTLEERFWSFVEKRGPEDCWEWTGHKSHGYGYISTGSKEKGTRKELRAPRVALEIALGRPLQDRMVAMHKCDNRGCVNPAHLLEATQSLNLKDAFAKGRHKVPSLKGMASPKAVLADEQVLEIRRLKGIERQIDLAARYGVSAATISHIWTGRNWRCL